MKLIKAFFFLLLLLTISFTGCAKSPVASVQTQEWMNRLYDALKLENQSVVQYERHTQKYNAHMPYHMVIPQEYEHVNSINSILNSYNQKSTSEHPPIREGQSLQEAYVLDRNLESDLLNRYRWLIENSNDSNATQKLRINQSQTQHHYTMFNNAIRRQDMHRGPMRPMGPGMMRR